MVKLDKNRKRVIKTIIIFFAILSIFTSCIVGCLSNTSYYDNNTDKYLEFDEELYAYGKAPGRIKFFPMKLDLTAEIINYYYSAKVSNGWHGSSWEVVLHAKYEETVFIAEIERLTNYLNEYKEKLIEYGNYKIATEEVKNCKLFNYESFVVHYYVDSDFITTYYRYEYALLDRINKEIIYVYICRYPWNPIKPNLKHEYLPINFKKNEKGRTADNFIFHCYHYIPNE